MPNSNFFTHFLMLPTLNKVLGAWNQDLFKSKYLLRFRNLFIKLLLLKLLRPLSVKAFDFSLNSCKRAGYVR